MGRKGLGFAYQKVVYVVIIVSFLYACVLKTCILYRAAKIDHFQKNRGKSGSGMDDRWLTRDKHMHNLHNVGKSNTSGHTFEPRDTW